MNRTGKYILYAIVALIAVCTWNSCVTDECYQNKNSLPLAGFYSSEETPRAVSLPWVSIYGLGAPGDSVLQDSVRQLSKCYLPFRIDQQSTSYEIRYLGDDTGELNVSDVITFDYEIIPWFVSSACGAIYKYEIKDIRTTHVFIDSVTCPNGVIDNMSGENIRIYFRIATGED